MKWDDLDMQYKKDLLKTKDALADLQKAHDKLKRDYTNEVENMKLTQEDDKNQKSERIYELESKCMSMEEQYELSK